MLQDRKKNKNILCLVFILFLKVTSAIKHKNTVDEIINYAHRVYSLLLKLEKNKV